MASHQVSNDCIIAIDNATARRIIHLPGCAAIRRMRMTFIACPAEFLLPADRPVRAVRVVLGFQSWRCPGARLGTQPDQPTPTSDAT
jgi:hypothetical protein